MTTMKFAGPTFIVEIPTDWFMFSSPQFQTMFLSPPTADGQRGNFTVTLQPVEAPVSPQQFAENIQAAYGDVNITPETLRAERFDVGEVEGYMTINVLHQQDDVDMFQQQLVALYDNMIYVLRAVRPADLDVAISAKLDAIFATMFGSFRFRNAELRAD